MNSSDVLRKKINFILFWLAANIVGCSAGWALAEISSRLFDRETQWTSAVFVASLVFEGSLWLCRAAVLKFVDNYRLLQPMDVFIMLVGEAFGWLLGEGTHEVSGTAWITAGAMWAVILGSGTWLILWFLKLPKPKTRFWVLHAILLTFIGMLSSSLVMGLGVALVYTAWFSVSQTAGEMTGWLISGAITGAFAGFVTGLAFLWFLFRIK